MQKKQVSIALQGGGIQSAFAWGVLDLFLQDERLEIMGISSTSLGGISAAALIQGLIKGGNELASATLRDYWIGMRDISQKMAPFLSNPLERIINYYNFDSYSDNSFRRGISPYEKNPLNINPLLEFIESFFDFNAINEDLSKRLFISATHVETGKIKVFSNEEITPKVLMASFCLPYIFHAVEIDGEHYWDGGMIANPAIKPIINGVSSKDIIVIQLVRSKCPTLPTDYGKIESRLREINHNAHLVREMRAIYFITKLIDEGKILNQSLKRINMHVIRNENSEIKFNLAKNFSSDWGEIINIYTEGYNAAKRWLATNYDNIGVSHSDVSDEVFEAYL